MEERVSKLLSQRKYCSRRKAEELISLGLVFVDSKQINLGDKVDDNKIIQVKDEFVSPSNENKQILDNHVYIALNKPLGVISSSSDPQGRKCAPDLIDKKYGRLFCVGRLDVNSSGLLFLTDDGEFSNLISHPSSNLGKTYLVTLDKYIDSKIIKNIENGVFLDNIKTSKAKIEVIENKDRFSKLFITIHEGMNRQVRRMFNLFDYNVTSLKRVKIGFYSLPDYLKSGEYEEIDIKIIKKIKQECIENRKNNNYKRIYKY